MKLANIAIVTDSNSGITQVQAKELGLHILPMPFMINEETFLKILIYLKSSFMKDSLREIRW